jgi:hypothetical protein
MSHHAPSTADGWHGSIPDGFPAEPDRYHLYIGLFCPFAHRVNFVRHLKGLTELIDLSVVIPYPKGDSKGWPGWRFPASNDEYPGATVDRLFGEDYLHKIYFRADPEYKGRYSVPVLWDRKTGTIVCNVRLIPRGLLSIHQHKRGLAIGAVTDYILYGTGKSRAAPMAPQCIQRLYPTLFGIDRPVS